MEVIGPLRKGQEVSQSGMPVRVKGALKRRARRPLMIGGGY